jgi:hypothetical protein
MSKVIMGALTALALVLPLSGAFPAAAHPHTIAKNGQVIANGQLHAPFVDGVSCGGDPAAYGLETAHHGPDAGDSGKADGCYRTTGGVPPAADDRNTAID